MYILREIRHISTLFVGGDPELGYYVGVPGFIVSTSIQVLPFLLKPFLWALPMMAGWLAGWLAPPADSAGTLPRLAGGSWLAEASAPWGLPRSPVRRGVGAVPYSAWLQTAGPLECSGWLAGWLAGMDFNERMSPLSLSLSLSLSLPLPSQKRTRKLHSTPLAGVPPTGLYCIVPGIG